MMIEVFKTNVEDVSQADQMVALLLEHFPGSRINFDMHDCDKVLRVEGEFIPVMVMTLVNESGFQCTPLQ